MSGLNKVQVIGNVGKAPEVRSSKAGDSVCNFSVAVNEKWKDKQGQMQERTEWVRVAVWGKLADLCGQYLEKGRQVYVEGRLQTREYTDKEGKKAFSTEVVAAQVLFLGNKNGAGSSGHSSSSHSDSSGPSDSDIPF
jgi:single-strand DNA-binding protein